MPTPAGAKKSFLSPEECPPCPPPEPCISAASNPQAIKLTPCSLCKKTLLIPPLTRCKDCLKVYYRIRKCKNSLDPEFREIWENMSRDKKTKFRNETQEFRGRDLRAKMIEVCSQEIQSGTYMDSEDLAEKYRNNPVILESILTNAKRRFCPTRGILLYEDRSKTEGLADNCVLPKLQVYH